MYPVCMCTQDVLPTVRGAVVHGIHCKRRCHCSTSDVNYHALKGRRDKGDLATETAFRCLLHINLPQISVQTITLVVDYIGSIRTP